MVKVRIQDLWLSCNTRYMFLSALFFPLPYFLTTDNSSFHKTHAATPSKATTLPAPPIAAAALPVCCATTALLEATDAVASLRVTLAVPETALEGGAAGAVVGSATPAGQCQWSPWGSHVVAVALTL